MEHDRPLILDLTDDSGANTAEYSIVTLAAVAFAGVLAAVISVQEPSKACWKVSLNAL